MNENMKHLEADRGWLEGQRSPLRIMRMALELEALAAGYKLHDEKTED